MSEADVGICVSPAADELQELAASELRRYLKRLFNVNAKITVGSGAASKARFVLGLAADPLVLKASGGLPRLSAQGHVVRRTSENTVVLAGGSGAAVAWAVYELVERYGVRYLLHEDVFPDAPGPFNLPDVDATFEPVQKLRSWRQFNDLPTGPAMWSLEQQRSFIKQVFKLKFNGVYFCLWPHQPFVDYEASGIRRQSACMLFGQKIPIDNETIGREHLPDVPYLNNPAFLGIKDFPEMLAAGKRLIHSMIEYAKGLGMQTAIAIQPLTFPWEFGRLLEDQSGRIQLGDLVISETGRLTNPNHTELIRAKMQAYLKEYGEVDELMLHLPEHPQAERNFRQCWRELAEKYELEPEFRIDEFLARVQSNYLTSGGPERAEREFKSAVAMLHFFDRFFAGNDLLEQAAAQEVSVGLSLGTGAVETFPFLDRVLWPGATVDTNLDYTSSRAVRKIHNMEAIDASKVPAALIITLQDDNVGSVPQVATESIHVLMQAMSRLGWRGYYTRYWPISDLDPTVAYMARASWDASVTPRAAYRDHFGHVYGRASAESFCQVMRMLEDATVLLDVSISLLFPVLGIMTRFIESDHVMPEVLFHVRATYEQARRVLERLRDLPGPSARGSNLAHWISRLDFSIHALREVELLCEGGLEVHAAKAAAESGDGNAASEHLARARDVYSRAVAEGGAAMEATAGSVRDDSDRATLAAYYHFLVREVKQMTEGFIRSVESEQGAD